MLCLPNFLVGSTKRSNKVIWLAQQNNFVASIATKKFCWDYQTFVRSTRHFSHWTDRASASSRLYLGSILAWPQLRLDYAFASISCEHCRSSRNNPHYAPRHIIYYYFQMIKTFIPTYILTLSCKRYQVF